MSESYQSVIIKKLEKDFDNKNVVTLPLIFFNKIRNIYSGKLKVGMKEVGVSFLPNMTNNIIEINEEVLVDIYIDENTECNIKVSKDTLSLGPVIAVFTSNGAVRKASKGEPNFRTAELMKANREGKSILYFFSIKDIDFINHNINGTYFNESKLKWEKKLFPFPDVLYDRGGGTLKSQKIISKYIRKQFSNMKNLIYVNPTYYFDKWDVYEKLVKEDSSFPYLPLTRIYQGSEDLDNMFKNSSIIFMKDCYGSNGRAVVRIEKLQNETYVFSYFKDEVIEMRVNTFDKLVIELDKIFKRKKKVIIQSAINLIKINNKAVDMRATVQRNGNGDVVISAYPVRIATLGSPVTSTKSGSKVYRFEDFFKTFMNYSNNEIVNLKKKVDEFLITIYKDIEKNYGRFGEIGIDFAVDQNSMLWFIECNAKPGKDTLYLSYGDKTIKEAFLNPIQYSKYLSGF